MSRISEYLQEIREAVYGKDVRSAIYNAINTCYQDATAGITPTITTETVAGGTQVNITVGDATTSFVVENGTATDTQVETYISEWLDDHPEATTTVEDGSITVAKLATDTTELLDALDDRVTALEGGTGLTSDIKQALLACFANVAWASDDGQDYYDALDLALNPPADLSSITAVYTQSGTVYDTDSLDSLKSDLVVTAHYSDNTTATITNYTLSGTLTEGTSTITVSYGGKTTTFNVTVTEYVEPPLYSWDFRNNNLTDSVENVVAQTTATQVSAGIKFESADKYLVLNPSSTMSLKNKRVEIDIASMSNGGAYHSRLFSVTNNSSYKTNADADSYMWKSSNDGWYIYNGSWSATHLSGSDYPGSYFSGKTLVLTFDASGYLTVSVDGTDLITFASAMARTGYLVLGGSYSDQLYRLAPTISAVRIYAEV